MNMVHIFLADGFEEIEAFTVIDVLRRCGIDLHTVSVTGKRLVVGAHGISTMVDGLFRQSAVQESNGIILPGGMPGTRNLMVCDCLCKSLRNHVEKGRLTAAICAAPSILGRLGLLDGRSATCYPGFEKELNGALCSSAQVVEDHHIITGRGPGAALPFAFAIAARFVDKATVDKVKKDMLYSDGKDR